MIAVAVNNPSVGCQHCSVTLTTQHVPQARFFCRNTARKQRAQGVRLNDEFHSLNNNLIGFPEEERTQARITYSQSEVAIQSWSLRMEISSEYVALIAQSYAVLRAFSWQLRMAPFPMEALLVALATPQDSALRDEVRVSTSPTVCTQFRSAAVFERLHVVQP